MRGAVFLAAGLIVGFTAVFFNPWMQRHASEIARPLPAFVPRSSSAPERPPLDTARLKVLQDKLKNNPKDFAALVELGNLQFDQQNYEEAANWYRKGLEVQPQNVNARTDLGTALFYLRRVDEAIVELRKSLELDPTHPQTMFNLGVALLEGKEDSRGALEIWERLVATNPNFPQAALVRQQIEALRELQK